MAVVDRNSNVIANAVATPKVITSPSAGASAVLRSVRGYVTPAADDSQNSIHRFVRLPSNAMVKAVRFSTADATTGGAFDLGVYRTAADGGAVVDVDLFATAFVLTNGPYSGIDLTFEAAGFAKGIQPLWQAAGLTADPGGELDIAATITTTYNGAGTAQVLDVDYVV